MKADSLIERTPNLPNVWVVNALWGRVVIRRYTRHTYVIVFGKVIFDWWPKDDFDRLQLFGRTIRFFEPKTRS